MVIYPLTTGTVPPSTQNQTNESLNLGQAINRKLKPVNRKLKPVNRKLKPVNRKLKPVNRKLK